MDNARLTDPIDLQTLSDADLYERLTQLKNTISNIQLQFAQKNALSREQPEDEAEREWKKRALSAMSHHIRARGEVAVEMTRRIRSPKVYKHTRSGAFMKTAAVLLPEQQFNDILEHAKVVFPEAFNQGGNR